MPSDSVDAPDASRLRLLEDDNALGPSHSVHADIASRGKGRYSHWNGQIYFQASDNSDPRSNGRRYEYADHLRLPRGFALAGGLCLAMLLWRLTRKVTQRLAASARTGASLLLMALSWLFQLVVAARRDVSRGEPGWPRSPDLHNDTYSLHTGRYSELPDPTTTSPELGDSTVSARNNSHSLRGLAVLLAAILFTVCHQSYRSADWEVLTTKHYWNSQEWYYGGYADVFETTPQGLRAIQKESLVNYNNLFPFGETAEPSLRKHQVGGWPSTERLAVPYLAYLITALTRGLVDVWTVFFLLNVALWLSAIFFAYRLASIYFGDRYSPLFAALFITFYPAFTLNFYGIKIAYISTTFLLGGIFIFETRLRDRPAYLRFAVLAAIFFLGQFAAGGWLFLFVFLFVRLLGMPGVARLTHLLTLVLALVTALAALAYLRHIYLLPSAEQQMSTSYLGILFGSYDWVCAWMRDEDVSAYKFLNYAGFSFFKNYLPLVTLSFIRGHWTLMSLFLFALKFLPATRKFLLPFILLVSAGHGGYVVTGWIFHYGYLSAPAAMMLILPVAGFLGMLASQEASSKKALAILLLIAVLLGFMNQKRHAGLYYGGSVDKYLPRIVIHYGESDDNVEY